MITYEYLQIFALNERNQRTSGPSLWVTWQRGVFVVIGAAAAAITAGAGIVVVVVFVVTKSCGFWSWTNGIWELVASWSDIIMAIMLTI